MFTDTGENSKIKIINIFYVRRVDIFKMKEVFLFNNTLNTFYLWLYGRRTYGKGPFR